MEIRFLSFFSRRVTVEVPVCEGKSVVVKHAERGLP
jgi:hypothetical protein